MFSVYCTAVGARVLLDTSSIQALHGDAGDLVVEYRCSCGERGWWRAASGRGTVESPCSGAWPVYESA